MLLPISAEPFVAPTDRDMLPSERRLFVRTHRTCVFGYQRHHGRAGDVGCVLRTDGRGRIAHFHDGRTSKGSRRGPESED